MQRGTAGTAGGPAAPRAFLADRAKTELVNAADAARLGPSEPARNLFGAYLAVIDGDSESWPALGGEGADALSLRQEPALAVAVELVPDLRAFRHMANTHARSWSQNGFVWRVLGYGRQHSRLSACRAVMPRCCPPRPPPAGRTAKWQNGCTSRMLSSLPSDTFVETSS